MKKETRDEPITNNSFLGLACKLCKQLKFQQVRPVNTWYFVFQQEI